MHLIVIDMDDRIITEFLNELSIINAAMRRLVIALQESKVFREVEKHFEVSRFDETGARIYSGIESSVFQPINDDLHSVGMSFTVYKKDGNWIFDGDTGWTSYDSGYHPEDFQESTYDDIHILLKNLQKDYQSLSAKYSSLIEKYQQSR